MDIVDMYEYYKMQNGDSNDCHFDYCDHDDFNCYNTHLDEQYYCKDYSTPYVERDISSELHKVLFHLIEYLNHLKELEKITIKFEVNTEVFRFKAFSLTEFSIFILPTVIANYRYIYNTDLSLKVFNTDRYNQICSHVDISNELDDLLFSLLHEVGHCVHISTEFSSRDEYFSICNNCKYSKNDSRRGICNNCSEEKKQQICNYYCETIADEFAFKHLPLLKKMISETTTKNLDE